MKKMKRKITFRYEDTNTEKSFNLISNSSLMEVPHKGDIINISKTLYTVDKVITNVNMDKSKDTLDEFDNISYYCKISKKAEEKKEIGSSIDIEELKKYFDKKMEDLEEYISNVEFKMVQELDEDGNPIDILQGINELKDMITKIEIPKDLTNKPKLKILSITRKYNVRLKAGRGYFKEPINIFTVKGIRVKAPDSIKANKVYCNNADEINYLNDVSFNKSTNTYEGIELNTIYVDQNILDDIITKVSGVKPDIKEYNKYTLSDWIRLSILNPTAVRIENELDKIPDYDNTNTFVNYHIRNKQVDINVKGDNIEKETKE